VELWIYPKNLCRFSAGLLLTAHHTIGEYEKKYYQAHAGVPSYMPQPPPPTALYSGGHGRNLNSTSSDKMD